MSDFLTNLVIRSFSRMPSFQPMVTAAAAAEPSYVEPEEPVAHEPPVRTTDQTDEEKPIGAPPLVEAPLVETPLIETPLVEAPLVETPLVETPLVETPLVETQIVVAPPPPIRREVLEADPEIFQPPKPEFTEKSVVPPPLEPQKPQVNLNAPEIASTETKPAIRTSPNITPPTQPVLQTPVENRPPRREVRRKPTKAISAKAISLPPPPAAAAAAPPEKPRASIRTHKAEPRIVEQVTEKVIERPAVMIENAQEISTSFTTLVPKPTAQPLPLVNIKTRPNLPAIKSPDETEPAPLPPETVINVAIGRIEVRATPAAAPRRERQSPGPKVMTLDDYLQQRSRGAK